MPARRSIDMSKKEKAGFKLGKSEAGMRPGALSKVKGSSLHVGAHEAAWKQDSIFYAGFEVSTQT
jgi:hypothetical protein